MHHRLMTIAGCVTGAAALALVAWLVTHAADHTGPMTTRAGAMATLAILLGMASIGLLCQARREYIDGVRETVDRLAAALRDRPTT